MNTTQMTDNSTGHDERHPDESRSRTRSREDSRKPCKEILQRARRVLQPREPAHVCGRGDSGVLPGPGTLVCVVTFLPHMLLVFILQSPFFAKACKYTVYT